MSKFVTAVYSDRNAAEAAVNRLIQTQVSPEDISILMSDGTQGRDFSVESNSKAPEGAATGAAVGGTLGAIAAGLVAVGVVAAPGIGLVAAGPVIAALSGAGAGGAAGGLVGALVGAGIPEHEAKVNAERLEHGDILVGVQVHDDRADDIEEALKASGGTNTSQSSAA